MKFFGNEEPALREEYLACGAGEHVVSQPRRQDLCVQACSEGTEVVFMDQRKIQHESLLLVAVLGSPTGLLDPPGA